MRITVKAPETLLALLQEKVPSAAKTRLRKMVKYGGVLVDGAPAKRPDQMLQAGQVVEIHRVDSAKAVPPPLPVIHEDQWLVVVDKPPGLLSIAALGEELPSAYDLMNEYLHTATHGRGRIYIVHRLDGRASGLLLFAKGLEAKKTLQHNWDQVEKRYQVLVEGYPPAQEGTIQGWLRENAAQKMQVCGKEPGARLAITHYRVQKRFENHALLEVRLETGRKNQIRVHMASVGCPVVGDRKYGAQRDPMHRLGLHASYLSFPHPITGVGVQLELPLPKAFRNFIKAR